MIEATEPTPVTWQVLLKTIGTRLVEQFLGIIMLIFTNIIPSTVIYFGLLYLRITTGIEIDIRFTDVWISLSLIELVIKTIL